MTMTRKHPNRRNSVSPPSNPYLGQQRGPGLVRILEATAQDAVVAVVPAGGEQDDGGDDGEDDDIRSGGDYGAPAGYVRENPPSPLLRSTNPSHYRLAPLGSALPPSPNGDAVATASDDSNDDMSPAGIYDGLAKLDPNTIIDKDQLASMFGVSEKTIRRRVDAGELPPSHMKMRRKPQWFVGLLLDELKDRAKSIVEEEKARRQHIRDRTE